MLHTILASASPRRSQLLTQVGIEYEVIPSDYEEVIDTLDPKEAVLKLSKGKGVDVISKYDKDAVVIGADTVVACDGQILGKPKDGQDAFRMLSMLSGRSHYVYTGVYLSKKIDGKIVNEKSFYEETRVDFTNMSEGDIWNYIATGECMGKAGAYAIQGLFAAYIEGICGDYNNVVGLPVGRVYRELRDL